MLLEVGFEHDVVYEACNIRNACCICCRVRTVKCKMELEVREILLNLVVILEVE